MIWFMHQKVIKYCVAAPVKLYKLILIHVKKMVGVEKDVLSSKRLNNSCQPLETVKKTS